MAADTYLLGHDAEERQRLEDQARLLGPATETILTLAGIEPGMRVLDLGTGSGDVALTVADMVGPSGAVVAVDQAPDALAHAAERCERRGMANVTFVHADVHTASLTGPFDAVVSRLLLLYTPDPATVLKRYAAIVRPGGVVVAMEYEMTAAGLLPSTPLAQQTTRWILEAFRRSGLDPMLGARLGDVLEVAGLEQPTVLGLQTYLPAGEPMGPRMVTGILRTLLPVLERAGIATADEVGLDTLHERLATDQAENGSFLKPPTLVGSWSRVA
jgi:protein-L-isoaspartate O-methyltransferase